MCGERSYTSRSCIRDAMNAFERPANTSGMQRTHPAKASGMQRTHLKVGRLRYRAGTPPPVFL